MSNGRKMLAQRLREGETIITGWSCLAAPILAELMARSGYQAVMLDMQHGLHDDASVREGIASALFGGAHPIARPPVDDFAAVSRFLDFGAEAVIMPMVNSADDALALVSAAKYPPVGARSWGPFRATALQGADPATYPAKANQDTLALAMIETPAALQALDDILAVDGLDGVFVGPSDLSLTLSDGAAIDPLNEETLNACAYVAERAREAGKIAGLFGITAEHVRLGKKMGFSLISLGIDSAMFEASARDTLAAI